MIQEIGSLIINHNNYAKDQWRAIALVGDFSDGMEAMHGYAYFEDGEFASRIAGFDCLDKIQELREEMIKCGDKGWSQCLIHIVRPDLQITIRFEYENPKRWSPGKVALDMRDFAELLKPSF
ncbi:conserved hypothetical protein [Hahella chejuensis KCTC 2396]|uniref:Uncharacterized protein n=2 Tax=Hahella chejuensis TaxID=158327 RepID=Q2SJM9_HAHCH|nr:conserved hypothetical protein [Hahella chejuensis KCTC 2396]